MKELCIISDCASNEMLSLCEVRLRHKPVCCCAGLLQSPAVVWVRPRPGSRASWEGSIQSAVRLILACSSLQSDHKLFRGPDLSDCCDVQCSAAEDAGRGAVGAAAARRLGGGAQADAVGVPPRPAGHPLRDLRDVVERWEEIRVHQVNQLFKTTWLPYVYNNKKNKTRLGKFSRCFCNHLYGKHKLKVMKNGRFGKNPCQEQDCK